MLAKDRFTMQYGYFDDVNKEYVITNPNTPAPWSNYLGSTNYGAIITNNAGGYSFYKSAAQGRFIRYRTNAIPMDQPGRYIYIRDMEKEDFWSSSWQPVAKSLDEYKTLCRHGTAYSIIEAEYKKILTETTYFIPLGKDFEYWHCKITNQDTEYRKLRLFTFVEYSSNWHLWQDIVNLQYSQYILTMKVADGVIDHGTNIFLPPQPDNFEEGGQSRHTFLGVAGVRITGFDTDRKKFLGNYGSYSNPKAVAKGRCFDSLASGDNGCGVLQFDIELAPQTSKEFVVVMGIGSAEKEGRLAVNAAKNSDLVTREFNKLRKFWHGRLEGMHADTPDRELNSMVNVWNPYNCLITSAWSRAASLVYAGERDGLGFRDTVQDLLGILHMIPEEAGRRIELMVSGQVSCGGALPVVKPFSHKPGSMEPPGEDEFRSDDCLWLFNLIPAYVRETGDIDFYNRILPYADKGKDTVVNHLKKSIDFTLDHLGPHGLPCGLAADWNDCLVLGQKGESIFVAFQLRYALVEYISICDILKLSDEKLWARHQLEILDRNIEEHAWDGEWYIRAYRDDGLKYGSHEASEGSFWLNPQSWAIYSGHARGKRVKSILKHVHDKLFTDYGLMICDPPYEKADLNVVKATLFNKGMKENGAVFCHTQGWAIIAETVNGNGNRAFEYFRAYLPAAMNDRAEIREIEPYVYSQSTHSIHSKRYGASRLPWLTGAAAWSYYAVTHHILGIRPEYNGMTIDPCIPERWDKFVVKRRFRNKMLNIEVINNRHQQKGVSKILINDAEIKGSLIPIDRLKDNNFIKVIM